MSATALGVIAETGSGMPSASGRVVQWVDCSGGLPPEVSLA